MLPTWRKLLQQNLDVLVYSGDMDGILPTLGTMKWIEALNMELREPFQAWLAPDGEDRDQLDLLNSGLMRSGPCCEMVWTPE